MRKSIVRAAVAALGIVAASSSAQAGLLVAPGFEFGTGAPDASAADSNTPLTAATQNPWFGPRSGAQAYSSNVGTFNGANPARNRLDSGGGTDAPQAGTQYGYAYSVGSTFGYLAQSVTGAAVVPGDTYAASAYFINKAATATDGDRLQAGGSYDTVQLQFLDSAGVPIGANVVSPTRVDSSTPQNVWTPVSLTAVAPAGTASIVFYAYLTRGSTGGVMFVDSADLVDVTAASAPEPASLAATAGVAALSLVRRRRRRA